VTRFRVVVRSDEFIGGCGICFKSKRKAFSSSFLFFGSFRHLCSLSEMYRSWHVPWLHTVYITRIDFFFTGTRIMHVCFGPRKKNCAFCIGWTIQGLRPIGQCMRRSACTCCPLYSSRKVAPSPTTPSGASRLEILRRCPSMLHGLPL